MTVIERGNMYTESDRNIDYEKLRKKLIRREFLSALITQAPAGVNRTTGAIDASHEELIAKAVEHGINLDRYKCKSNE